jgi:hypothetical protein
MIQQPTSCQIHCTPQFQLYSPYLLALFSLYFNYFDFHVIQQNTNQPVNIPPNYTTHLLLENDYTNTANSLLIELSQSKFTNLPKSMVSISWRSHTASLHYYFTHTNSNSPNVRWFQYTPFHVLCFMAITINHYSISTTLFLFTPNYC